MLSFFFCVLLGGKLSCGADTVLRTISKVSFEACDSVDIRQRVLSLIQCVTKFLRTRVLPCSATLFGSYNEFPVDSLLVNM